MRQCYRSEQMKESIGIQSRMKGLRIEEEKKEETLSLSDLSIYNDNDSEEWEKYYDSNSNSSSTSTSSSFSVDEDLFEFNTEEWNKNNAFAHNPPENILFCGKLIPYRINPMLENTKNKEAKTKRGSILPRGKSSSRWYIFLFGFPTHEMELKDLKNRQSRKVNIASSSPSSALLCPFKNDEENVRDKLYGRGKEKKKGMWGLIKALNCSGSATYEAQSVVKASIGCISLV
ncbi:hypothetical protein A4A49_64820 [Nicotiana attenuata]|uniref:Uncharacterized protein n=1 Tax=Nicotiana attenuata TaxID=49451 RepID=A0A1J6JSK2_NICAT|nr:hypothetical protein A4A49_64820 [Nicotiana attenuata]